MKLQLVIVARHGKDIAQVTAYNSVEQARKAYYEQLRQQLRLHSWFRVRDIIDADESQLDAMLKEFSRTSYPLITWVEVDFTDPRQDKMIMLLENAWESYKNAPLVNTGALLDIINFLEKERFKHRE